MTVFAVVLQEPNREIHQRLSDNFSNYFSYTDTFFLLEAERLLTEEVAKIVGVKGDNRLQGISGWVLRLDDYTYSGYTSKSLWEWLQGVEKS